jgi:hypothetical protein
MHKRRDPRTPAFCGPLVQLSQLLVVVLLLTIKGFA